MADTDLLFRIIAQDEYKQKLEEARLLVDKMTDSEKEAIKVEGEARQAAEASAAALDKQAASDQQLAESERSAAQAADTQAKSTGGLQMAVISLNQGLELAQKGVELFKKAYDFAKEGAAIERIGAQFDQVAADFGANGKAMVAAMDKASDGVVDDEALMQIASRSMTQGVIQSQDQLVKFTEIARASSVRFGGDTAQALQSILYATEVGAARQLKSTIGVVDFTKAYDDLAVRLGKRKQDLTDEEMLQARVNVVIEKGDELVKKVGDTSNDAATKFEKFDRNVAELGDNIKTAASDAFGPIIQRNIDWTTITDQNASSQDRLSAAIRINGDVLSGQYNSMGGVIEHLQKQVDLENAQAIAVTDASDRQRESTRVTIDAGTAIQNQINLLRAQKDAVKDLSDRQAEAAKVAKDSQDREMSALMDARGLAIAYTKDEEKLADKQKELEAINAAIAANGPARVTTVQNQKLTTEQRALAEDKLRVALEDVTQIQRKKGETDAEYNLRLSESKNKVDALQQSLGTHTAAMGGATKAQLEHKAALEDDIAAMQKQSEVARATDAFNALTQAYKSGALSADEYSARATALNDVTGLYSMSALSAAIKQEEFIKTLSDPRIKDYKATIDANKAAIDGQTEAVKAVEPEVGKVATAHLPNVAKASDATRKSLEMTEETISGIALTAKESMPKVVTAIGETHGPADAMRNKLLVVEETMSGIALTTSKATDTSKTALETQQVATEKLSSRTRSLAQEDLIALQAASTNTKGNIDNSLNPSFDAAKKKLDDAGTSADTLAYKINSLPERKDIDIYVNVHGSVPETGGGGGETTPSGHHMQHGGSVEDAGWYFLHPNEFVLSAAMRAGQQAIPDKALPASGYGAGQTNIYNNNFYDAMAAKMWLEQQRLNSIRSVAEAM